MTEGPKQIGEVVDAWEDLGPTRHLPSSEPQTPRSPPATILAVIGELGLRYPPAAAVDRESHAARVALLAKDCADLDPYHLRLAADEWAKREPYFPRACELRDAVLEVSRRLRPPLPPRMMVDLPKPLMDRRGEPMSTEDTAELNRQLEAHGATARYREDGSRYLVERAA